MLLQRHASAGEKLESASRDRARPLDQAGEDVARLLPGALAGYTIERIVSSPHRRCLESVGLLAHARGLEVESREELVPDGGGAETRALLDELPDVTLVCTHREVFERLFDGRISCEKGGTWVVERRGSRLVPVKYLPPPIRGNEQPEYGRVAGSG